MTFLASAAFTMDPLCIFVITTQDFFSVLLISFSCMNYFLWRLFNFFCCCMNKFFMRTTNYFFSVLRIIFNTSIENYFFIVLIIIFHGIMNLFLGLQCFGVLQLKWTDSSLWLPWATILKTLKWRSAFKENAKAKHSQGKKRKRFSSFLQNLSGASCLCVSDDVFWTEDLIVETMKRLHDLYNDNFRKDLPILILTGGHKN